MKKLTLLFSLFIFSIQILLSQPCSVNVDSLKGKYTGDCRDELADGYGTATGTDSYTGNFKNGYPEGEGKYTWKNGSWYEGTFKKGICEGKGVLHKLNDSNRDSTVDLKGFWKKGKYVGRYEKPYIINTLTNNVSDVSVRKISSNEPEIIISVKSITGGAGSLNSPILYKPVLVDVQLIEGRFQQQLSDEASSRLANKYTMRNITFPFYAIFSFQTPGDAKLPVERIGIELYENCSWGIQVTIDN